MNAQDKHWLYQFTNKAGKRVFYNCHDNEWGIECDYSALVEPTIKETAEILNFIVETQMDAWGELFGEE
jgi:hypothetical protein